MTDYYKLLNVRSNSSIKDIYKSFKGLALPLHSKRQKCDLERFLDLNEAYYILRFKRYRNKYNSIVFADVEMPDENEQLVEEVREHAEAGRKQGMEYWKMKDKEFQRRIKNSPQRKIASAIAEFFSAILDIICHI